MMTLSKIAKLANVSVSTASKAFSGSNEVNEETRQRVFEIAKQHGCFQKFYNTKYQKLILAIIVPEFNSAHYTRYISSVQDHLDKNAWEISVSTTNFHKETEKHLLDYYYKHANADAIIVIGARTTLEESYEIPVVFIESSAEQQQGVCVSCNTFPALQEALAYLKDNHVETIGFIGEVLTGRKQRKCLEFAQALGLQTCDQWIQIADRRFAPGGYEAMEKILSASKLPRAIVCAYDYMAMGAIRCLTDHGLRVPEDVAILGFDDIPEAKFYNPPLASVSASTEQVCALAVEAIEKQLAGVPVDRQQQLQPKFCLRTSFAVTETQE